jgi:hypothetical protein
VSLDDVHNAPIALVYPVQSAALSPPQKEITVIRTGGDKLVIRSDEVDCNGISCQLPISLVKPQTPYHP